MRNLLLHRLPADRARELEDRLIQEEDCADRLRDAKYDLLDDYAGGRLTAAERADVEHYLLDAEDDRWRLAVARGLARRGRVADRTSGEERGVPVRPRQSAAAWPVRFTARNGVIGVLLAACVVLVAVLLTRPLGNRGGPTTPQPASLFTLTLLANAARGESVRSVSVPSGATAVRVQAEVGSPAAREYRLAVLGAADRLLFNVGNLVPRISGAYVYVETEVPARALSPGAHRITVSPEGDAAKAATSSRWDIRVQAGR